MRSEQVALPSAIFCRTRHPEYLDDVKRATVAIALYNEGVEKMTPVYPAALGSSFLG
jgi:hypothetical protein